MTAESKERFAKVLAERHAQFNTALTELLQVLVGNDQSTKHSQNMKFWDSARNLAAILAEPDHPIWLRESIAAAQEFNRRNKNPQAEVSGTSYSLLKTLMKALVQSESYSWGAESTKLNPDYDFDAIFEEARAKSSMSELFDRMIAELETILASGEVDSIRASHALERLIQTLQSAKSASYFSTVMSIRFLKSFMKHAAWGYVKALPGVQTACDAFENAMHEMDIEAERLGNEIGQKVRARFDVVLEKLPSSDALRLLPAPDSAGLVESTELPSAGPDA